MRGMKPVLVVDNGALPRAPKAPSGLDASARREFDKAAKELVELGFLRESDLPMLELYAIAMGQVRKLQPLANKEPAVIPTGTGSSKTNPTHTMLNRYMTTAKNIAAELGLTPAGRGRKGVQKSVGGKAGDYLSRLGF
jgi:P27 family predicted phage terminase small subunit